MCKFVIRVFPSSTDILNMNDCFGIKSNDEHKSCREEYQQLKHEFELYKQTHLQQPNNIR